MKTTSNTVPDQQDQQDCPESGDAANDAMVPPCFGKAAGRPRAADKEARLQSLLHTAAHLFLEKGYSKVSLEMIAREAHVAVRTIYVKFGGKVGLLNAVIVNGRAHFFGGMANLETDTRPMEEILGDFSLRFLELISMPAFSSLHRMVVAEARTSPELAQTFFEAGPKQTRQLLARFFSRPDIAAQLQPGISHEELAIHLLNCLCGDNIMRMLFEPDHQPTREELQARVKRGLDLFLRGVLRSADR